jgi:tetratricopeptide (TPR) repeat protein
MHQNASNGFIQACSCNNSINVSLNLGIDHLSAYKCNLATTYEAQGRYEEAEALFRTTLESDEWDRDFWPKSECMAQYGHHLADIYREQGRYDEAERMYLTALENKSIRFPAMSTVRALDGFARLRLAQGCYPEAEDLFTEGIEIGNSELPGKGHPLTLNNVDGLGVLHTMQGVLPRPNPYSKWLWTARS